MHKFCFTVWKTIGKFVFLEPRMVLNESKTVLINILLAGLHLVEKNTR